MFPPHRDGDHSAAAGAAGGGRRRRDCFVLLRPPLPSASVSTGMERGCQQSDSLADGQVVEGAREEEPAEESEEELPVSELEQWAIGLVCPTQRDEM